MNIQSLLKSFTEKGILIWIDQEKVKYRAPKGIMKPSDIQTLKDNKNEIITYLNSKTKLKHDEKQNIKISIYLICKSLCNREDNLNKN